MPENLFRLGAVLDLYCRPLVYGIENPEGPALAGLSFETAGVNTERLLQDELDAGFIGPIDFARNSSDFALYPSIGVASRYDSGTAVLCLHQNLRKITSIAVGVVSSSDIILAKIILSEKFEQDVTIVPVLGSVEQMLSKADAALLAGNAALSSPWNGPKLDLVDEWTDMTELPFVHLLCAARKSKFRKEIESLLRSSKEKGVASLSRIASEQAKGLALSGEALEEQLERYSYSFDEEARAGLGEFFHYAFYLGILPDVPEIEVFGGE